MNVNNIFEKELNTEEINKHIKNSMESPNIITRTLPTRLYIMAKEEYNRQQKEKAIIGKMYESDRRKVKKVNLIGEDSAIIETYEKLFGEEEKSWFRVYLNGRVESEVTTSFDMALIQLVCIKNECSTASSWISRMLNIKESI